MVVQSIYIENALIEGELIIPETVTSILPYAFCNCKGLTSITIPNSVTSIGIGSFNGCSSIESITIPFVGAEASTTSNDMYQYPLGYIFGTISYTGGTGTIQRFHDYTNHYSDTTYYIPNNLKSITFTGSRILAGAFYNCSMLTSITICNGATSIAEMAFSFCSGLTSLTIPDSVTSIGSAILHGCSGLTSLIIPFIGRVEAKYNYINNNFIGYIYHPFGDLFGVLSYTGGTKTTQYTYGPQIIESDQTYYIPTKLKSVTITGHGLIRKGAFHNCSGINEIVVQNASIESKAFSGCSGLKTITIPTIYHQYPFGHLFGTDSFSNAIATKQCYYNSKTATLVEPIYYIPLSLSAVTVLSGAVQDYAFINCNKLTSISLLSGVTSIGENAFSGCSSLINITLPFVGKELSKTAIDAYQYPLGYIFGTNSYSGGKAIQQNYYGSSTSDTTTDTFYIPNTLRFVTITNGCILHGAFYGCNMLTSIVIPNNTTSIGGSAFYNCSALSTLTIPDSVTTIEKNAFYNCTKLNTIYYMGDITKWCTITGLENLMTGTSKKSLYINGTLVEGELSIPHNVTSIENGAFCNCSDITSVTIPDSISSFGDSVFANCDNLVSISLPNSVTSIGEKIFYNCSALQSITIPNSVTTIGEYAFCNCSSLLSINIPNNVSSIGDNAFKNCSKLRSVNMPNSITILGNSAFANCFCLETINIPDNVLSIGESAFSECRELTNITIGDRVNSIGDEAFRNCISLESLTIGDSVSTIGIRSFSGCGKLTSIIIPKNVIQIGTRAFYGCNMLDSIMVDIDNSIYHSDNNCLIETAENLLIIGCHNSIIPADGSVTTIESYAFYNCSNLTFINIPDEVTTIRNNAFYNCCDLQSVTIGNGVTLIGYEAFRNCIMLNNITIGNSVTSIADYAFFACHELNNITISDSVNSIGNSAFSGCYGLTSVTIGNSVTSIGNNAFSSCYRLIEIYNKSTLGITTNSSNFGSIAQYAKNVYTTEEDSKLSLEEDGYLRYTDGSMVSLIAYYGNDADITIPTDITELNRYVFYNCSELHSVTIGDSVNIIGNYAFYQCSKLTSFNYNGTTTQWRAINKGTGWKTNTNVNSIHCTDGDIV